MQSYIIEPRGGPTLVISYTCHWTREAFSVMMYRAQRKWWIGVLYFNFTSHIFRTKFTELQCLPWCPYVFFLSTIVGWNAWILSSLGTVLVTKKCHFTLAVYNHRTGQVDCTKNHSYTLQCENPLVGLDLLLSFTDLLTKWLVWSITQH